MCRSSEKKTTYSTDFDRSRGIIAKRSIYSDSPIIYCPQAPNKSTGKASIDDQQWCHFTNRFGLQESSSMATIYPRINQERILLKGAKASSINLKCCLPHGIPMMVMDNRIPKNKWVKAIQIPPVTNHTKFITVQRQPEFVG
jgi:hypothetical protein